MHKCIRRNWILRTATAGLEPNHCVYHRWNRKGHLTSSWSISLPSVSGSFRLCQCAHNYSSGVIGHPQNKSSHSYSPTAPRWTKGGLLEIKCPYLYLNSSHFSPNPPCCHFFPFTINFLELCCKSSAVGELRLECQAFEAYREMRIS